MSRTRGSVAASLALPAVAAGTTWIAMYAWRDFTFRPGLFLNPLFLLAIVVAGTGTALRWWRMPAPLVVGAQLVASGVVAMLLITGSPLPIGGGWTELHRSLADALDTSHQYAAPVPNSAPPLDPLLILCGLACLLLVDFLACTLRKVPLAGLPLLTIYSIPVSMVDNGISWWVFAATAAGFLVMLFLQESDHVARWGRPIGIDRETGDPISYGAGVHVVRSTASAIGGVATALAIFLPALVPTAGVHLLNFGPGHGGGDDIRIDNPTADLVRDLKRGDDTPLVQVTTTDPDPSYLRILALTRFTDVEWSPGNRDVPADQRADGLVPGTEGVAASVASTEFPYNVTILPAFNSRWLPTEAPISRIQADGDWRYDTKTMDFLAVPGDLSTSGMQYSMTALKLDITSQRLEDAGASVGRVSEAFTDLPADIPPIVRELAVEVTRAAPTRFDKAVALQNWFRDEFSYSLDTAPGSGYDALTSFLSDDPGGRVGYCEQFASAMAVMARLLGIPARVAIGFLHPDPAGPNTWVYSSDDMHAWPELYFEGAGWVRFEPTPAGRAEDTPTYTQDINGPVDNPTNPSVPGGNPNALQPTNNRPSLDDPQAADAGPNIITRGKGPWIPLAGGLLAVIIVGGLLLLPRFVRRRRRERRLTTGGPEEVWAEVRDTAIDLGVPWPAGRSPRSTRNLLVDHLGAPVGEYTADRPAHGPRVAPTAVEALDRLVHALELLRYARPGAPADPSRVRADGQTLIDSLAGGAMRTARRRATWWPRSVLSFAARPSRIAPPTVEARYGGVVDHVN